MLKIRYTLLVEQTPNVVKEFTSDRIVEDARAQTAHKVNQGPVEGRGNLRRPVVESSSGRLSIEIKNTRPSLKHVNFYILELKFYLGIFGRVSKSQRLLRMD